MTAFLVNFLHDALYVGVRQRSQKLILHAITVVYMLRIKFDLHSAVCKE